MSEKMLNAPVYYALAQAQFNPIAAMAKYADEIQDRLRKSGYTLFLPQEVIRLQITTTIGQPSPEPHVTPVATWLITKADKSAGFILGQNSLTYHTTNYETCNEFIPELLNGLKIIHEVITLDHISRLGLRYLDAVMPRETETVDQYLKDGLHGMNFGANQKYMLNESVYETETGPLIKMGTLVARVHRVTGELGYPPDMTPNGLDPLQKYIGYGSIKHAVIDTDHFSEGVMPLNFDQIKDQLMSLHGGIKLAFESIVSDHALDVWSKEPQG